MSVGVYFTRDDQSKVGVRLTECPHPTPAAVRQRARQRAVSVHAPEVNGASKYEVLQSRCRYRYGIFDY